MQKIQEGTSHVVNFVLQSNKVHDYTSFTIKVAHFFSQWFHLPPLAYPPEIEGGHYGKYKRITPPPLHLPPFGRRHFSNRWLLLVFKQSYLEWSDYILNFNEMATAKPRIRTPRIRCVNNSRWGGGAQHYSALFFCFYVNDWTISGLQPSFLIQQHEGKKMLCWINCRLNLKCKSLRVYVCISAQLTAPSNRRILSNFKIWLNRS